MLKKVILVATLGYSGFLAAVSLINIKKLPNIGGSFSDKIYHFLAYGLLTVLWFATLFLTFNYKKNKAIFWAFILSVIFGIIIELLQGTLTNFRTLDVYDILANTVGALLMSLLLNKSKFIH